MTETVAVFGGTGRTGKYFIPLCLAAGYHVRALARTPSKVETQHPNLTVIQGDFSDTNAIQDTVKGSAYVISMAGGPQEKGSVKYPPLFMTHFVEALWPILDAEPTVKTFLYQASVFVPKPDGSSPLIVRILRPIFGYFEGITKGVKDNEEATKFIGNHKRDSFKAIVTRPGNLEDIEGGQKLIASSQPHYATVAYKDLAAFNLEAMKDESLEGQYPYVAVAPKK